MSDVLILQQPPVPPPESALIAGMAAPEPLVTVPDTSGPMPPGPQQEPGSWTYDFNPSGVARATFNGEVAFTSGGSATAGVTTWNGRTGAVVLTAGDVTAAGGAPLASPTFTGLPTAPTASAGTATTQIATTAFVGQAIAAQALVASFNGRTGAVTLSTSDVVTAGGAPTASPAFTGTPTGPTAVLGTATGQLATTQFVANAIGASVVSFNGRTGAVLLSLSDVQSVGGAPVASPVFTGVPAGPTAAPGTSTTQLASTAFVTNAVAAATAGVSSFNTRTGAVTLLAADVTGVGGALLLSPNFTGTPTAPTATAGDSTTKIATTAFVATAIGSMAPVVVSFNARTGAVTLQASDVTGVGGALLASPAFSGTPSAPTPTAGDNSTRIATTAFVATSYAPLASPTFSGTVSVPTAAAGTNTTQAASTAYVVSQAVAKIGDTMTGKLTTPQLHVGTGAGTPWDITAQKTGGAAVIGISNLGTGAGATANFYLKTGAADKSYSLFVDDSNTTASNYYGTAINRVTFFYTGNGALLEWLNSGNLQITPPSGAFNPGLTLIGSRTWNVTVNQANGDFYIYDSTAGAVRIDITPTGACWNATGTWGAMSDERTKRDVQPYRTTADSLARINQLVPVMFKYNGAYGTVDDDQQMYGLIAQQVEPVMPELVTARTVEETEVLGVDSGRLMFAMIQAVKELTARIAALESKLA